MKNLKRILFIIICLTCFIEGNSIAYPTDFQEDKALTPFSRHLDLAKACIEEGDFQKAKQLLNHPYQTFEEGYYEQSYLLGDLYFKQNLFDLAIEHFEKALPSSKVTWYSETLYYLGWAHFKKGNLKKAETCFSELLENNPNDKALFALCQCRLLQEKEIHDLLEKHLEKSYSDFQLDSKGWLFCALNAFEKKEYTQAKLAIDKAFEQDTLEKHDLFLKGVIYFQAGHFEEALSAFNSTMTEEAIYWSARSLEALGKDSKELMIQLFENYPESKYAPDAYFHLYSYHDYMQGDLEATKHLRSFVDKYPKHPLTLNALYLLGIDCTRDRKSPEGKWIRKKSYHEAIDYFEKLEKTYVNGEHDSSLYHQALFERSSAYLKMANESQGAKKQILLQYAEETLRRLLKEPLDGLLKEESSYWLAKTVKDRKEAKRLLNELIHDHQEERGYFLSKAWFEQGVLAKNESNFDQALKNFSRAEETAKGLSSDERLEILIEQSECHKLLNNLDQAMLILSQAINDDAISGLRLKAMYLRSEIYEKQERFELARKQLEATAKKGGEWGKKAIAKLERVYGY